MKRVLLLVLLVCSLAAPAFAQVKMTKEQILFYTSDWKGERFPDGRPKVPNDLLTRALDVSIEDVWDFLRGKGLSLPVRWRTGRLCTSTSLLRGVR